MSPLSIKSRSWHIPTLVTTATTERKTKWLSWASPCIVFHFATAFISAPGSRVFCISLPICDVIRYDMMYFSKVRVLFLFHPSLLSLAHGLHFESVFQKWKTVCWVCFLAGLVCVMSGIMWFERSAQLSQKPVKSSIIVFVICNKKYSPILWYPVLVVFILLFVCPYLFNVFPS